MTQTDYGSMTTEDDLPRVEFERVLDAAIDAVWEMLTTDDGLERWLAPSRVDLRMGGTMDIDFGDDGIVGGEIIDLVPGIALEYRWRFPDEPDSVIRFELEVITPDRTRLRLNHRLLPVDQAVGYGAGWHAHLDQLAVVAMGEPAIEWTERFNTLLPEYEAFVS